MRDLKKSLQTSQKSKKASSQQKGGQKFRPILKKSSTSFYKYKSDFQKTLGESQEKEIEKEEEPEVIDGVNAAEKLINKFIKDEDNFGITRAFMSQSE